MAGLGEEQVGDELDVEGPVARVVEDEDGVDFEGGGKILAGGVDWAGEGAVLVGGVDGVEERVEGVDGGVGGEDVGGGDDVAEAVGFGDESAFGGVGAGDEDGLVAEAFGARVDELAEGGVGLDEVVGG